MTTTTTTPAMADLDKLDALALAYECENSGRWYNHHQLSDGISYEQAANFIVAADPTTVRQLIALARRAAQPAEGAGQAGQVAEVECRMCHGEEGAAGASGIWMTCPRCNGNGLEPVTERAAAPADPGQVQTVAECVRNSAYRAQPQPEEKGSK